MRAIFLDLNGLTVGALDVPAAPDVAVVHDLAHLRIFRALPPIPGMRHYEELSDALHLDRVFRPTLPALPRPSWRLRPPSYDELQRQSWWWRRDPGSASRLCYVRPSDVVQAVVYDLHQIHHIAPAFVDAAPLSTFSGSEWAPAVAP